MVANIQERFLVHGPRLNELTDFLYFDKVVYPTTLAYVRPFGMPSGSVGYKLSEGIGDDVQERLRVAGLLCSPGSLLPPIDFLTASSSEIALWREEMMKMNDTALRILDLPHDPGEHRHATERFLTEIDGSTRYLAGLATGRGKRTVTKLYSESAASVLRPGNTSVLSVVFSQLPSIDPARVSIKTLIDFLSDEDTKIKRRRLFDWQNGIETAVEKGEIKIEHVPDRLATLLDDYTVWIKSSGLSEKVEAGEFLLTLGEAFIEGLTIVGLPKAIKALIGLGKRKIDLGKEELHAPGREIAYIAHCKRELKL